jgi:hypothetical protein
LYNYTTVKKKLKEESSSGEYHTTEELQRNCRGTAEELQRNRFLSVSTSTSSDTSSTGLEPVPEELLPSLVFAALLSPSVMLS